MKPTLEEVASKLCEGGAVPEGVIERLRQMQPLLSFRLEFPDDDEMERQCFESALHLQRLLPHYVKAYEMGGEEYPVCIDDVLTHLNLLIPILAEGVSRFDDEAELIELAPGETSLDFLRKVYRSVRQPMARRMRAAIEALQHEHPRLGAIATTNMSGQDFAALLERAIERSGKEREMKQIEG